MAISAHSGEVDDFELFELLPDAILAVDQRGVIRYANSQAGQLFGQEPATLVSTSVEALLPEHLRERHIVHRAKYNLEPRTRAIGTGLDLVGRRADGTTFPVDIMLKPLEHLAEPMVLAIVRDITERRAVEEQKRKLLTHDRLQLALDAAQLGWWHYDPLRRVVSGDARFKEIFDVAADETPVEEIAKRLHPDDVERFRADREAALDTAAPKPCMQQYRVQGSDGEVRWVETNSAGVPDRAFGVIRDVTAHKNAKDAQAHLAAIVTSSADAIVGKTLDGIVTSWNEAAERMFGYSAGEMIGQSIRRLIPVDLQAEEDMILDRLARSESIVQFDTKRIAKDGRTFDASVTISPVRDAEGRIVGAAKIVRDITARKQAEELLRRQADLLDQSHDAIVAWRIGGRITYWSRGAERLYGYTAEEAVGRNSSELLRTRSAVPDQEIKTQIEREGSWYGELFHTTRDGRTVIVESRHVRVTYEDETYALETNRDITTRKQTEDALRASEERFRSSLLHSPIPIVLFDDREEILAISETWLEQTGYSREELRGVEDWTARAHGELAGQVLEEIRRIIPTNPTGRQKERMIRTKDGRNRLWNFVTSDLGIELDGRRLFVCAALDVTERKAHDEQVQLLMREAIHRAKNILSLVQAIARQTIAREPEDFLGRFTERLQALAANQDLLVRNKWQGVDVEDLVRAQLAHFADLFGSRVAVHGPKLALNSAATQAIGLALHELATNAGKYGALSTDAGRIDVGWQLDGDTFTMSWTERGGPPVQSPERRGFGSTVIDSMVKRSLNGEVQFDYAQSGLEWRLTCQAAEALEEVRQLQ